MGILGGGCLDRQDIGIHLGRHRLRCLQVASSIGERKVLPFLGDQVAQQRTILRGTHLYKAEQTFPAGKRLVSDPTGEGERIDPDGVGQALSFLWVADDGA